MKVVGDVVQYILNMGASVMLPIMIFIIALIFRVKASKALRSALTIGIGMVGINLVINLLTTNIGPAAQAMVKRFGFHLTVIDVGWPSAAAGAWGQPISSILIPILLVTNLVLLITGITKTLDIDIWNYWHMVAAGSVAYIVTQSWIFSIISAILYMIFCLLIADWTAKDVQEFYGLEGISFPTGSSDAFGLLGIPISWVVSKIPGLGKIDVDAETIQKKFGIFGEPMMMGIIIGIVIGILAGYDVAGVLTLGINMGAVMMLMPRMVKLLMEGLMPISEAARELLQKRTGGKREILLGMDAALSTGAPATLAVGLLLVPITLFIAVILPGNKVLPFGDLATIPFYVSLIVARRRGNIINSVITGAIVITIALFMATNFTDVHTQMLEGVVKFPAGAAKVSSLDMGGNFLNWILLKLAEVWNAIF
ncbi:PTS galactitol transporter subunit IIC [Ligilactobacillus salivarius]|uniref:PTS system, galactitol-specific IIC component n=3 Tax=Ligilactobacillus salivarius TaxID=1624 RepID=V6DMX0_9LACO|nr:PTS transporter subunit IIC [Ligilactobacillus salivarius]CDK35363.1 PTS system, galactitol-specific IIC component [Ligilactobacillus salivarius cp400]AIR11612.1 Galacitol PTS, EIIC [Ligilactobacillus salivarius]AOO74416.1 PTS galactitol transporter subunit IIC [Ligilactobacillus salivarius]MBL1058298.1 PTS galactitol transporter subunit IIC [Ligilactobacillus salivarius]MDH4960687.1 PTS transporter subunit IIC [Ligilactobacillus salivarius]